MKKLTAAVLFTAVLALQAPANAAVIVTSAQVGNPANVQAGELGSTYITFEDVAVNTIGTFTSNGFNFTGAGGITNTSSIFPFTYLQPKADNTHYLAVGFNAGVFSPDLKTETLTLNSDYTKFGFYWGSIDQYNTVAFLNNGVTVFSLSGSGIPGINSFNPSTVNSSQRNRYVNFDFTGGWAFDQVVFQTSFRAFEVDNLALAGHAPELSTWAMMLIGFAGLGLVAYRRAKKHPAAASA